MGIKWFQSSGGIQGQNFLFVGKAVMAIIIPAKPMHVTETH